MRVIKLKVKVKKKTNIIFSTRNKRRSGLIGCARSSRSAYCRGLITVRRESRSKVLNVLQLWLERCFDDHHLLLRKLDLSSETSDCTIQALMQGRSSRPEGMKASRSRTPSKRTTYELLCVFSARASTTAVREWRGCDRKRSCPLQ